LPTNTKSTIDYLLVTYSLHVQFLYMTEFTQLLQMQNILTLEILMP